MGKTSTTAVKEKLPGIVVTAWKFWPLIHCITYSVIPARHRILWVNCVDLVWNAILASMSQGKDKNENEELAAVEEITSLETVVEERGNDASNVVTSEHLEQTGIDDAIILEVILEKHERSESAAIVSKPSECFGEREHEEEKTTEPT